MVECRWQIVQPGPQILVPEGFRRAPPSDVKLALTGFLGHLGSGSPVLAKVQVRHFDVEILAIETVVRRGFRACVGRGFRACKVRS